MSSLRKVLTSPWLAAVIILLAYLMSVTAIAQKSITFDELGHLAGGHLMWAKGDFRTVPHNGNLPQRLAGLASFWRDDKFPAPVGDGWNRSDFYEIGDQFLYQVGNNPESLLLSSRCMMALLLIAMGTMIFFWSRSLFGSEGAMVSVILFAFSPSMLAHGPLITSDLAVSFFFCASMGALWRLYHRVDGWNILWTGLALAGLFLSKTSSVLIVIVGILMLLIRLANPEPLPVQWPGVAKPVKGLGTKIGIFVGLVFVLILFVWFCIWAAFDFRYSAFCDSQLGQTLAPGGWNFALDQPTLLTSFFQWLKDNQLFPEGYLFGAAVVVRLGQMRQSFLNGEYSLVGFHGFFPYAFTVKETLPFLLLLLVALAAGAVALHNAKRQSVIAAKQYIRGRFYATAPLWLLAGFYFLFSLTSNLNIGHRHLLPVYPPLFILAGAAGTWFTRKTFRMGALVTILLVWHVGESLYVRPHYLAYFNQLAGGPSQGYKHLVDSSLDWGQDLPGFKRWLDEKPRDKSLPVYFLFFGTGRADKHGIQANMLPGYPDRTPPGPIDSLRPGIYAISATLFEGIYQPVYGPWTAQYEQIYQIQRGVIKEFEAAGTNPEALKKLKERYSEQILRTITMEFPRLREARLCAWLRQQNRKPDDMVGYSILIFNLTANDLRAALEGPVQIVAQP